MQDFNTLLEGSAKAHGHMCSGQVIGVRMAMLGCRLIGLDEPSTLPQIKKIIVYVEIDRCATDAISYVTGVKLGRRSLKFIENGGGSGYGMVYLDTKNLKIEHCTFANSANYPIYVASAKSLSAINDTSTYVNNNDNRIYFAESCLSSDATMVKAGTPYLFSGSHYINDDVTLTIDPGVEVFLNPDSQIYIGSSPCSTGRLVARGTEKDPVIFTGSSDAPWSSLRFYPYTGKGSILSHCIIENGGNSGLGMVYLDTGNLTIDHCTFQNSASCPIYLASANSLSAINGTSIYSDNKYNRIYVPEIYLSSDITRTIPVTESVPTAPFTP